MKEGKLKNFCKAAFNVANLAAIGAIPLSHGIGSRLGTALFIGAAILGTYNKYHSLNETKGASSGWLQTLKTDPTITAKVLMAISGYNALDAAYDTIAQSADLQFENACRTATWLCGVIGDNALRKLDKVNFNVGQIVTKSASKLHTSFHAAAANPVLFYNGSGIALAATMLATTPLQSLHGLLGLGVSAVYTLGIGYALSRTWQAANNKIPMDKINDGFLNYTSMTAGIAQTAFAAVTGQTAIAIGMGIFSVASVKSLYETRSALRKEQENPKPAI